MKKSLIVTVLVLATLAAFAQPCTKDVSNPNLLALGDTLNAWGTQQMCRSVGCIDLEPAYSMVVGFDNLDQSLNGLVLEIQVEMNGRVGMAVTDAGCESLHDLGCIDSSGAVHVRNEYGAFNLVFTAPAPLAVLIRGHVGGSAQYTIMQCTPTSTQPPIEKKYTYAPLDMVRGTVGEFADLPARGLNLRSDGKKIFR